MSSVLRFPPQDTFASKSAAESDPYADASVASETIEEGGGGAAGFPTKRLHGLRFHAVPFCLGKLKALKPKP